MTVDNVTDENYALLKQSARSVLVASESWCGVCEQYAPIVEAVSDQMPGVLFGKAVLDQGKLGQFKREHPDISYVPMTFVYKNGVELVSFEGFYDVEGLSKILDIYLRIGDNVYLEWSRRPFPWLFRYFGGIQATIKDAVMDGGKPAYVLHLNETSPLGLAGAVIRRPAEEFLSL